MQILIDWKEKATENEVKYETKTQPKFSFSYCILSKERPKCFELKGALIREGRFQERGAYKIILEIVMKTTKHNITSHLNSCL